MRARLHEALDEAHGGQRGVQPACVCGNVADGLRMKSR
jgi:hypothetical protein